MRQRTTCNTYRAYVEQLEDRTMPDVTLICYTGPENPPPPGFRVCGTEQGLENEFPRLLPDIPGATQPERVVAPDPIPGATPPERGLIDGSRPATPAVPPAVLQPRGGDESRPSSQLQPIVPSPALPPVTGGNTAPRTLVLSPVSGPNPEASTGRLDPQLVLVLAQDNVARQRTSDRFPVEAMTRRPEPVRAIGNEVGTPSRKPPPTFWETSDRYRSRARGAETRQDPLDPRRDRQGPVLPVSGEAEAAAAAAAATATATSPDLARRAAGAPEEE